MPWFFPVKSVSSFDEEAARLCLCEARDLGIMAVEVDRIVGSVGRWRDFDARFRLINRATRQRYRTILEKMREGYTFPPIHVYKVYDRYYVADGNHRVAAAKELGVAYVDAHIQEFVPGCDEVGDAVYWRERSTFETATRCNQFEFTNPDSYRRLLSHLQTFRQVEAQRLGYDIGLPEATQAWLADVDGPVRRMVRAERMLSRFQGRTEDDLVFYFIHHYYGILRASRGPENVTHRDVVARMQAIPGRTLMGRFRRLFCEVIQGVRDVVDNLAEMDL